MGDNDQILESKDENTDGSFTMDGIIVILGSISIGRSVGEVKIKTETIIKTETSSSPIPQQGLGLGLIKHRAPRRIEGGGRK